MADIWFYHLGRQPLETVLPRILASMQARGDRISVHASNKSVIDDLSKKLWTMEDTGFVPHGLAGEAYSETQSLLLCLGQTAVNASAFRFFIDGAYPETVGDARRTSIFFDGSDEAAVANARTLWKRFSAESHAIKYWKQSDAGRWEDQAMKQAA
jgi:DNA polymerase III subunit chi